MSVAVATVLLKLPLDFSASNMDSGSKRFQKQCEINALR